MTDIDTRAELPKHAKTILAMVDIYIEALPKKPATVRLWPGHYEDLNTALANRFHDDEEPESLATHTYKGIKLVEHKEGIR